MFSVFQGLRRRSARLAALREQKAESEKTESFKDEGEAAAAASSTLTARMKQESTE